MSEFQTPIARTYDSIILDTAWKIREKFALPFEDEVDEVQGFYIDQRNGGDELSPGNYDIVEWQKSGDVVIEKALPLDTWIQRLSSFSESQKIKTNPNQLVSAIIDICLAQDKLQEKSDG